MNVVVDDVGDEDINGDYELVVGDDSIMDFMRR